MGLCFEQIENIKNLFILKEPNSDLYTFFCDPNGAGQRIFYHQRMHLKGSFGPEFNGCASPKTEMGKPNVPHMFVAFLC